jgi:hypothetical protein
MLFDEADGDLKTAPECKIHLAPKRNLPQTSIRHGKLLARIPVNPVSFPSRLRTGRSESLAGMAATPARFKR